jgi:hypothetical protein
MDWDKIISVAATGIISVFLALGILSMVVGITGYLFNRSVKN